MSQACRNALDVLFGTAVVGDSGMVEARTLGISMWSMWTISNWSPLRRAFGLNLRYVQQSAICAVVALPYPLLARIGFLEDVCCFVLDRDW